MKINRKKLIIAIDGPAGSGKSTTARLVAKLLKLPYIDTGAMYRAITLKAVNEGITLTDTPKLIRIAKAAKIRLAGNPMKQKVFLDGKNVSKAIRKPELTNIVFYVAREPKIRREMVKKQREMGQKGGAVMEGRDIGTVVFPKADYKFFFIASDSIRAKRRQRDLRGAGVAISHSQVLRDIKKRDFSDTSRKEGPLKRAKDAKVIDTTPLTIQATAGKILAIIRSNSSKAR